MNEFIKLGLGLVAFGLGWEIAKKPKSEKVLTAPQNPGTVETPIANSVPTQDDSESETSYIDDSGQPDSGESV
jgi:hypothetical protein